MSLAKPLPALRQDLRALLIEDLPAALIALDELLPDGSEKKAVVTALRAALNQLNKDSFRGLIDPAAYALRLAQISARYADFLDALTEADFEPPAAKNGPSDVKRGSVLYKIPRRMPIRKPSICTVRVAVDEETLFDDLVLDDGVRLRKRVAVSEMMSAELLDTEGNVFKITPFNSARQRVLDTGYTQWLFSITPLIEGEHQLLVKVSLMEFDANIKEYIPLEVSILETVTIVTEGSAPSDSEDTPLKSSGHQFSLGPTDPTTARHEPFTTKDIVAPTETPERTTSKPLRAAALFLAFLLFGSSATWAFTPPVVRDWWVAALQDTAESYRDYIQKHGDSGPANPRLEKAYFRKAEKTDSLSDLRLYQERYPQGSYEQPVVERIARLEERAVTRLEQQPDSLKVRRYLVDFPDATRLPRVKQVVEQQLPISQRTALLPAIETAYVRTLQVQATPQKFEQYRRDYPRMSRLTEVAQALAAAQPAVRQAIQPALDDAVVQKMQSATTTAEVQAVLPALMAAGSSQAAERVEQTVEQKPAPLRRQVIAQVREARGQVQQRERASAVSAGKTLSSGEQRATGGAAKEPVSNAQPGGAAPSSTQSAGNAPNGAAGGDDSDADGVPDKSDGCPTDKNKATPGPCGCGKPDTDTDSDGVPDCNDQCPNEKGAPADLGCPPLTPSKGRKSGIYNMVRVAGGAFTMGSPESEQGRSEDECPHSVTVAAFSIGQYEVTQADWREVMGNDPSYNKGCDDCPVEQVSWNEVQDFIKKLNARTGKKYRLPTEAEWEYAAKGGAKSKAYTYAGGNQVDEVAWYSNNYKAANTFGSAKTTHPVGTKKPNELHLYDLSGNVWEWCQDVYRAYPNCTGGGGGGRVSRGGGWNYDAQICRSAYRGYDGPTNSHGHVGFRLALQ